ncbi:MAG: phage portal protein [Ruminococcus sp.]|nr:phage portal protein [Ruminococcus sp.]
MPKLRGIDYLRRRLAQKRVRVLKRYVYYDMKNHAQDLSGVMPKQFDWLRPVLGWCARAADSIADRIVFETFTDDGLGLNEIFDMNSKDVLCESAVSSALVCACSFIYIAKGEGGYPTMQAIDGSNATGIIDPVTRMLNEGYAVLERDEHGTPMTEAYFTAGTTWVYLRGKKEPLRYDSPAPYALLVPFIHRPDPTRPFGRSRISRACMELTDSALRTLRRSEVSAEFYSFPQKYVLGLDPEAVTPEKWAATISSFLRYDKDSDGDHPVLGQFQQQSMSPYNDQLRTIASMFASETGLTLDDLGFSTANPTTPEAIRASHESLRLSARKAQRDFAVGFLNAGYLAACLRDGFGYDRSVLSQTKVLYEPIFEPDAAQLTGMGDAVLKIQQSFPDYFDEGKLHKLTGL